MFQYIPASSAQIPNQVIEMQGLDTRLYHKAVDQFNSLHRHAGLKQLWYRIRRQAGKLLDLSSVNDNCRMTAQYDLGSQSVALEKIVGSTSRSQDFDAEFYPLRSHLRQRWVKIATLRYMNVNLPAVELIQIGEGYFVIDGHHRISVARALGQRYIDAQVIVWHLEVKPRPEMIEASLPARQLYPSGLSLAKGG